MQIKENIDKTTWENFCLSAKEKTFTHSYNWGLFNEKIEDKVWRFGVFDSEQLQAIFLVIKVVAKRGTYLLLPMGPIIKEGVDNKKIIEEVLVKSKEIAKKERADFIRIAPIVLQNEENKKIFKELGFKEAPMHVHPELTWELDITKTEDEILQGMRKTTRYLIKQGLKNIDIEIDKSTNADDLKYFNDVYKITAKRHNFTPFSMKYLENELSSFKDDDQVLILNAKYKGEVIASAMIIFWSNIAFYHQGASSQKYPKIPTSYLIQWEAIKEAKQRGCHTYNFWGIARDEEINNKNHPWAGLTLFKKGFGGYSKEYVRTQDYKISFKYYLIRFFEILRKIKRNL
ncbi:MAG TPA: peptidoglycan bridge formation glycyltransferase FemA/FemB family protein [Candidatus Pacearchaeota archaeon]|nr:peptidoglycan bridge formation glycyltransferase FemA/FemB family protein [Candidatus Pacearchaeota archaeon]